MNSTSKQPQSTPEKVSPSLVSDFEAGLLSMRNLQDVELLMKKLKFLGLNYDPFNQEIPSECREVMESLNLPLNLENPYQATNILLRLLDKTEEQINNLKQ